MNAPTPLPLLAAASWPTTNAEFLTAIFGAPGLARPRVCCIVGDPSDPSKQREWNGWPWSAGSACDAEGMSWYFTLSAHSPDAGGNYSRKRAQFAAIHGAMLDDVGTKGGPLSALRLPPSVVIETSAGNYQALYLYREPVTDLAAAEALQDALITAGLCDPGADGPSARYGRLPFGVNGKRAPPFACRLVEWHPELRYTLAQVMTRLQLTPAPARVRKAAAPSLDKWNALDGAARARLVEDLRGALAVIESDDRATWVRTGHRLKADLPEEVGRPLWEEFSEKSAKCDDNALDQWDTFDPDQTGHAAVFAEAQALGWVNPGARPDASTIGFGGPLPAGARSPAEGPYPTAAAPVDCRALGIGFSTAAISGGKASLSNVLDALQSVESGVRIGYDAFLDRIMIGAPDGRWRRFRDVDAGLMRAEFERRGFRSVPPEIMRTAVRVAAEANRFDSAIEWAESLVWDGKARIDMVLPTYFGADGTDYSRAVGRYMFSALAARALDPGHQVDMVPVFISEQGRRKSSALQALVPDRDFFTEINLKKIEEDNLSRLLQGKLVGEIAELRGLVGRDQESVKAWVTRRVDEWRANYVEHTEPHPRRMVLFGTTNETEFLDDLTGERRWLPVKVGAFDTEGLARDRDQLWAEGIAVFRATGVAWQEAERLAPAQHGAHKIADPWAELVEDWLGGPLRPDRLPPPPPGAPLRLDQVARGALQRPLGHLPRAEALRLGKVLRSLDYEKRDAWINGKNLKAWVKKA